VKFGVLALDYDGTIARDGVLDPEVRSAIADVRARGIAVGHASFMWRMHDLIQSISNLIEERYEFSPRNLGEKQSTVPAQPQAVAADAARRSLVKTQ